MRERSTPLRDRVFAWGRRQRESMRRGGGRQRRLTKCHVSDLGPTLRHMGATNTLPYPEKWD